MSDLARNLSSSERAAGRMPGGDSVRIGRSVAIEMVALEGDARSRKHDDIAGEEPLELRIADGKSSRTLAITMRTPGNDFELAAGFFLSEGLVRSREGIATLKYCVDPAIDANQRYNIVTVELHDSLTSVPLAPFERHFTISSACGVCGRAQLDLLHEQGVTTLDDDLVVAASLLYKLPERMRKSQRVFASTGGLHAAALFDESGETLAVREDVGRHNAVDKLIGWALLNYRVPLRRTILLVSGRASYEILQKSAVARIPMVCSVSAPSSLAVELARTFNITLVGFLRDERANVYAGSERIADRL